MKGKPIRRRESSSHVSEMRDGTKMPLTATGALYPLRTSANVFLRFLSGGQNRSIVGGIAGVYNSTYINE
jgi:hypothetical protein